MEESSCFICFDPCDDHMPCQCKMRAHPRCLTRFVETSGRMTCTICKGDIADVQTTLGFVISRRMKTLALIVAIDVGVVVLEVVRWTTMVVATNGFAACFELALATSVVILLTPIIFYEVLAYVQNTWMAVIPTVRHRVVLLQL